jgi:hypothetical protein
LWFCLQKCKWKGYRQKVTKAGWAMYVEITTLKNGKKVSVTRHGPKS